MRGRDTGARRTNPAVRILLMLAALALLATTIGVVSARDDPQGAAPESDPTSSTSTSTSTTEPDVSLDDLTGPARDLAELLAAGRQGTYHARYRGTASGGQSGTLSLETWVDEGRVRQDTVVDVTGQAFHRANFVLEDTAAACTRLGDAAWSCEDTPRSEAGADLLNGSTLEQLTRAAVGEAPGEVDGREARCFTITLDAQTTELCASPGGIPLRIRSQSSELVIEMLEDTVDGTVFEVPAEPA